MVYEWTMRKKRFDEEGSEVLPAKNRPFKLKARMPTPNAPSVLDDGKAVKSDPLKGDAITYAQGLERAYEQGDAYAKGKSLFIAGSHTAKDWFDDFTKIPKYQYVPPGFFPVIDAMNSKVGRYFLGTGDLTQSTRYKAAEKALRANPNIEEVVGHSLGGAVALELQKHHPNLRTLTYGAPVCDSLGKDVNPERDRHDYDPVSMFDRSARSAPKANPFDSYSLTHDYHDLAKNFTSIGNNQANGFKNPDGTTSLTQ